MHVDFSYYTEKIPITYRHGRTPPSSQNISLNDLDSMAQTHCPMVFIDEHAATPLPEAEILAKFKIVLTTSQRLISEWKHGSYEEEMKFMGALFQTNRLHLF